MSGAPQRSDFINAVVAPIEERLARLEASIRLLNAAVAAGGGGGGGGSAPAATTSVLGIVRLSHASSSPTSPVVVETADSRMSDARTPTAHTHPESDITGLVSDLAGKAATVHTHALADLLQSGASNYQVVRWDSTSSSYVPRLLDDNSIASANKDGTAATPSLRTLGTSSTQAAAGNDARLSDTRTPTDGTVTLAKLASGLLIPRANLDTLNIVNADISAGAAIADSKLASPTSGVYRMLGEVSALLGSAAGVAANTRLLGHGMLVATGVASASFPLIIAIKGTDYTVAGKTPKLRVRARMQTNNVAPAVTATFSLVPITAGTGTSTGPLTTAGTVVSGSTATITTPAANSITGAESGDFDIPADGDYALVVTTNATTAANSLSALTARLAMHHV